MTAIIALAVIGVAFVLAELVLPGGIIGIGGVICLILSVVLTFTNYGILAGGIAFLALIVFSIFTFSLWAKFFDRLPFTKQLVLRDSIDSSEEMEERNRLIGQSGTTLTKLSPSGHALINGEKLDVMTEAGVIEKGELIRVIDVRGPSLFVEKV